MLFYMKQGEFKRTSATAYTIERIKCKMTEAPVLQLPNFNQVSETTCDASNVGIGGVLSQEGHPITFYSEKLKDAKKTYSPCDLELYVVVQTICHCRHYPVGTQFVLFSDHEALKHLQSQKKLSSHHA